MSLTKLTIYQRSSQDGHQPALDFTPLPPRERTQVRGEFELELTLVIADLIRNPF